MAAAPSLPPHVRAGGSFPRDASRACPSAISTCATGARSRPSDPAIRPLTLAARDGGNPSATASTPCVDREVDPEAAGGDRPARDRLVDVGARHGDLDGDASDLPPLRFSTRNCRTAGATPRARCRSAERTSVFEPSTLRLSARDRRAAPGGRRCPRSRSAPAASSLRSRCRRCPTAAAVSSSIRTAGRRARRRPRCASRPESLARQPGSPAGSISSPPSLTWLSPPCSSRRGRTERPAVLVPGDLDRRALHVQRETCPCRRSGRSRTGFRDSPFSSRTRPSANVASMRPESSRSVEAGSAESPEAGSGPGSDASWRRRSPGSPPHR